MSEYEPPYEDIGSNGYILNFEVQGQTNAPYVVKRGGRLSIKVDFIPSYVILSMKAEIKLSYSSVTE